MITRPPPKIYEVRDILAGYICWRSPCSASPAHTLSWQVVT